MVTNREMREKIGHSQFSSVGPEEHTHEHHGLNDTSHGKHSQMAQSISDCKVVICGGMGMGAYESMRMLNIQPIVTDLSDVELAIKDYIDGKLVDHTELLH